MPRLSRTKDQVRKGFGNKDVALWSAMMPEPDRGCALVAGEFLSDALEHLLRLQMEQKGAKSDEIKEFLLNLHAPLGNFSPRIKAAFWFNLIGPKTYRALEDIRAIRNRCAHFSGPVSFMDAEIADNVRALEAYLSERLSEYKFERELFSDLDSRVPQHRGGLGLTGVPPQRTAFARSATTVFMTLRACGHVMTLNQAPPEGNIYGKW